MSKCKNCGEEANYGNGIFCSKRCQLSWSNKNRPKTTYKECIYCHKQIANINGTYNRHLNECHFNSESSKFWPIKKCPKCGKEFQNNTKFCSMTCANSHIHTEESISKIREGLDRYNRQNGITVWNDKPQKFCKTCGILITKKNRTGYCTKCLRSSPERKEQLSISAKKGYLKAVENGTFKGWQSRNIDSYPEKFWIKVLDNNQVKYQREKYVKRYFLDFVIEKNGVLIDLEIDGKQHKYEDRKISDKKRDKLLTELGYKVYRIEWNSINKENGKLLMKEKINKFIEFYKLI